MKPSKLKLKILKTKIEAITYQEMKRKKNDEREENKDYKY